MIGIWGTWPHYVTLPASCFRAGLQSGDEVIQFGTVCKDNFKSMQDVGSVVANSVGKAVEVVVRRVTREEKCIVIPREWGGKGRLGCHIVPL